jgi:protein-tyrosine kinase
MKIKKALEKAQQARAAGATLDTPSMKKGNSTSEWVNPDYSESRFIEPDYDILAKNRCIGVLADSPYIGAYKILRTQIHMCTKPKGWNTLMVTSVLPGEGKTLTAINLAFAFAKDFEKTVLLMDCDLHRQDVHKYMGIDSDTGLVDYLVDEVPLKDLIIWPGIDKITLLSGGRTVQESTELMESPRMRYLVEEVKNRYPDRLVIFDTPPVLAGADAIAFASLVDCIIMVVEAGKTPLAEIKKALELIPKDKFLGFVLNKDTSPLGTYYSYY